MDATCVASPWARASIAAGTSAAMCVPGDTAHCTSMPPLIITFTGSGMPGTLTFTVCGFCLVVLDEPPERRADVAVALAARGLRAARVENRIDPFAGARPCRHAAGERRRKDAVDADRTDALWMEPHVGEREVGAVGNPEDVPLLDVQRDPQIFEIVGALDRVVGARSTPSASSRCRHLRVAFAYASPVSGASYGMSSVSAGPAIDLVAGQARLRRSTSRAAT